MEAAECGAAALTMVLAYHGHHAPLSEVRQRCGVSRDGSNAKNIVAAARTYGLKPVARRVDPPDLANCRGPAILHWEMNHFVVLERWTPARAYLVDPAVGRRVIGSAEFDGSFTGILLEFSPGESFVLRRRAFVSRSHYLALLRGTGRALGMVLFASFALDALATVTPLTTQLVIDHVIGRRRVDWLFVIVGSAGALVTFSALWSLLRNWLLVRIRLRLDVGITQHFVAHLLNLPIPFFAQRSTADLMARIQASKTIRQVLADQSIRLLADGVMLLAYLGLMFAFDVQMSAIVLTAAALYLVVFMLARPLLQAGADEAQRKDTTANSALFQVLRGIHTIKSAGAERAGHERWINTWISSLNTNARFAIRQQMVAGILFAIQAAVPVAVLLIGGRRVLAGDLTPGRLVAFQMLQAGFLGPLEGVVEMLLRLQVVPVLLARLDDVFLSDPEPRCNLACPRLVGSIELDDVSFRYSPTTEPVLSGISMRVEKGKKVALVGASGSGKSTLGRLLLGLYAPSSGRILLDGHDLSTLDLESVRRQFGVVLQETALFDGTIADNLRLFYPNAPLEHVVQAARVAQIHDDIIALPNGYDTRVSASSGALSGGQRQRLALARAIVHRPPIMILDEATSALDAVTEAAIENYLATRTCTRVVIAHRLSTVRDADAIFVLDGGRVVEQGRHDELLAAGGHYARLVESERTQPDVSTPHAEREPISAGELASFDIFRSWADEERADLAAQLQRADFELGTRIVEQDARTAGLYLIAEGRVSIELAEPGLSAWTVTEIGPGGLFGEIGLLDGSSSTASVVACTNVRSLHLPRARFQDLLHRGEVLAVRMTLSLGAIVAERTREVIRRHADLAMPEADPEISDLIRRSRSIKGRRELTLSETLLGAQLTPEEIELLGRAASRIRVPAGETLFVQGETADTLFVLLVGRVAHRRDGLGTLGIAGAGMILGETSAFDAVEHPTSALALDEVVALAVGRRTLVEWLLSGQRVARRFLSPIAETLVRRFRFCNHRLREAVAIQRGELERAHAAREQALEAAREEGEALMVAGHGQVPFVRAQRVGDSAAACLSAVLRLRGRPVSHSSVLEAFEAHGEDPSHALPQVARSLGLTCRLLEAPLGGLRNLDEPILAVLRDDRFVVLQRHAMQSLRVMDPIRGRHVIRDKELRDEFSGIAFELRDGAVARGGSLVERVARFGAARAGDLVRVLMVTLAVQGLAISASLATAFAVQRVFPFSDFPLLRVVVAGSAGVIVSLSLMQQLQSRAIEHVRAHFDREMVDQLMTHILRLPIAFFDRFPPGELLQRFQAFENVRRLYSTEGVTMLLGVVSLAVGGALLPALAPRLVAIPLAVLLVYTSVAWLLFRVTLRSAADETRARGALQERLIEILQGVATLRMAGDPRAARERWLPSFLEEVGARLVQDRVIARAVPALEWVRGAAIVACVWLGARGALDGSMSVGTLVAFLSVLATFVLTAHGLAMQVVSSAPALVDYGLVRATFLEPPEQTSPALISPGRLRGSITVDQVSFRYADGAPFVLKDITLQVESGMKVALVGASGSGKSTLGRLLLGLYLPTSGRILFDGKDVQSLDLEAMRRRMGVVLQDPFLLGGSIRDNIVLGADHASPEQVVDAAMRASIHEDIAGMPMQYDTIVAEGGATFSGGQRQRIAIARALMSSPAVLLLDEATSSLDNVSQAALERNLANSTATRIVIAHRLSTIIDANCIVVLQKGRIAEQGTHRELLDRRGAYFDLVRAQL